MPHYRDLTPHDEQAAARPAPESRHRHLHPRGRGDAPDRAARARGVDRADQKRRALLPARVHVRDPARGRARSSTTRSTRRTAGCSRPREKNLPIFVPGWEDSTLGNMFAGALHRGRREERAHRAHRHRVHDDARRLVHEDVDASARSASSRSAAASPATSRSASCRCSTRTCSARTCRCWGYFCQISDSTTSYGSYSGAVPNEKITWGKLGVDTPKFIIESDATIVAPLIFAHVLGE